MENQFGFEFTFPANKPIRLLSVDELYDTLNENIVVDAEEDARIERKSASYNSRALGDYFSMWANSPPDGGIILIGVENNGKISGCSSTPVAHINELERAGDIYCPDARYQCKRVDVQNKQGSPDYLVAIRVLYREDKVVETTSNKAFTRRGSSKKELDGTEKRELQLMKGQLEIESEPSTLSFPADFNTSLIAQFAENVRRSRGLPDSIVSGVFRPRV